MPKAPAAVSPRAIEPRRHNPLADDYAPQAGVKQKPKAKRKSAQDADDRSATTVDSKASRWILQIGQELVDEDSVDRQQQLEQQQPNPAFSFDSRQTVSQPGASDAPNTNEDEFEDYGDEEPWVDENDDEYLEEVDVDPTDQDIFNRFNPSAYADPSLDPNNLTFDSSKKAPNSTQQQGTNLADLILEKIALHEAAQASGGADSLSQQQPDLDDHDFPDFNDDEPQPLPQKAITAYTAIGQLLSRQRSGALPKPFKILPSLPPEQIVPLLDLTDPPRWTPHVHLLATRLFISAKPSIAQPYLTTILLPRIRADIHETKRLHTHLYHALKKALYKPASFFKGIIFPLLEDGTATLREATIISSVVARVSVPVLHSAAALLRLCDIAAEQFSTRRAGIEAAGPTNIFIRTLLDKKYALPFKVVDALVFHFLRFKALDTTAAAGADPAADAAMHDADASGGAVAPLKLTVLWHQSLLAFAQRYRNDVTEDQREALLDLVSVRGHKDIGPEVRRELLAGRGRGVVAGDGPDGGAMDVEIEGGDDTMLPLPLAAAAAAAK